MQRNSTEANDAMRGLLVVCDGCHRTAAFPGDLLSAARREATLAGWTHNREADEIMRVWWCPACSEEKAELERLQKRVSDD